MTAVALRNPPSISIITVALNDLAGLERTVASIASQSYGNLQHVVIDGGSSDGSQAWLSHNLTCADTLVISEADNGIYDAMRKGLLLATGELVNFLNAGDSYAHNNVLRAVAGRWVTIPGWAWGYGKAINVNNHGEQVRSPTGGAKYSVARHALCIRTVCHQAVFMAPELIREAGGFQPQFGTAADYHLLMRAGSRCRPLTWDAIDIHFLTGGITERQVYAHLWRRHRARTSALRMSGGIMAGDAAWALGQMLLVCCRRGLKRARRKLKDIPAGRPASHHLLR